MPHLAEVHLSDAAELAAEISTQDGLPLAEARAIAAEHVARLTCPTRPAVVAAEPLVVLRLDELEAVVVDGGSVYVALDDDDNATIVADGVLLGVSRDELRRLVQVLGHPQVRRWLYSQAA